ncbi:MAG: hypothetical protein HUJ30_04685, partial [Gammaproteobacteria bacterium]|nr:hypothetical protein [Gammaproteobacteria bacterium]
MKKLYALFLLAISQPLQAIEPWTAGTAFTLSQGQSEIGVFSAYRHGLDSDTEISTIAYANIIYPNISLKQKWTGLSGWQFSSEHALSYPTMFLDATASDGIGGLLPPTTSTPELLTVNNRFYFSKHLSKDMILTPSVSIELTAGANEGLMPTIDFPMLYQRTASYHTGVAFNTGIDLDGVFADSWGYSADLEYFYLPGLDANSAWESKALLFYQWGLNRRVLFGYKFIDAKYPYGENSHAFPMLDVIWSW